VRRIAIALLLAAVAAGVAAVSAPAKEGVTAKLLSDVPLAADPGTRLRLSWTLSYGEGTMPFGANGVFVRLRSASGGRAETGFAPTGFYADGRYAATLVVPEGGIGDIEIGLRGFTSGAGGSRTSDLLFRITNDPLPGPARAAPPPASSRPDAWVVVAAAALLAAGAVGFAAWRRRATGPAAEAAARAPRA
jgi:hypothetical protein